MSKCTAQQARIILRHLMTDEQNKFAKIGFMEDPEGILQDSLAETWERIQLAYMNDDTLEMGQWLQAAVNINSLEVAANSETVQEILAIRIAVGNIPQQAHEIMERSGMYPKETDHA